MEKTELREQFFAEIRDDPYAHMATQWYAQAWADGYEQALQDVSEKLDSDERVVVNEIKYRKSNSDRRHDAIEYLTEAQRKAETQMIIAMAQVGSLIGGKR